MRTSCIPRGLALAKLFAHVPAPGLSMHLSAGATFPRRLPSRPVNMMRTSDSRAARRLGPAHRVYDGLGMLAEGIGAYTIHVCGRGMQPQPGEGLARDVQRSAGGSQALIPYRTTDTLGAP